MRVLVAVIASLLMLVALPASASADSPDITDECGITDVNDRTALPWQDICSATFDASADEDTGVVTVTATLVFDADLETRTPSSYQAIFYDDECQYWLMHHDSDGVTATSDTAQVRCGDTVLVPCDPEVLEDLGFFCLSMPDPTFHDIGFAVDGDTVTLTFSTSGSAAELPLSEGDRIDMFDVATGEAVAGETKWGSSCGVEDGHGTDCTSDFGDHAWTDALGHTIEARQS